jgi:uncharacterized cupin superfamily protein
MATGNLHDDQWDIEYQEGAVRIRRLAGALGGALLGGSVYELAPGAIGVPYHLHHANEELLVVVSGTPTMRTPDGETELRPGDVALFPRGAAGAHQVFNRSAEPCRYFIVSTMNHPEIGEFPDTGKVGVWAGKATGAAGEFTLSRVLRGDAEMGFWEDEPKP